MGDGAVVRTVAVVVVRSHRALAHRGLKHALYIRRIAGQQHIHADGGYGVDAAHGHGGGALVVFLPHGGGQVGGALRAGLVQLAGNADQSGDAAAVIQRGGGYAPAAKRPIHRLIHHGAADGKAHFLCLLGAVCAHIDQQLSHGLHALLFLLRHQMIAFGAHHAALPSAGGGAHEHTAAGQHLIRHAADGL